MAGAAKEFLVQCANHFLISHTKSGLMAGARGGMEPSENSNGGFPFSFSYGGFNLLVINLISCHEIAMRRG